MVAKYKKIAFIIAIFATLVYAVDDLLNTLRLRASEEKMYELISKINTLHFYINDYILQNGIVPTKIDLENSYPSAIDNLWWPKNFENSTKQIDFLVDTANFHITYSNIFLAPPPAEFEALFRQNIAMKPDSVYDATSATLLIPFELETIKFQNSINTQDIHTTLVVGTTKKLLYPKNLGVITSNTASCNTNHSGVTAYQPDGAGGFILAECDSSVWRWKVVPSFESSIVASTPSGANFAGQIQYDLDETNTSQVFKTLSVSTGDNFTRVVH